MKDINSFLFFFFLFPGAFRRAKRKATQAILAAVAEFVGDVAEPEPAPAVLPRCSRLFHMALPQHACALSRHPDRYDDFSLGYNRHPSCPHVSHMAAKV